MKPRALFPLALPLILAAAGALAQEQPKPQLQARISLDRDTIGLGDKLIVAGVVTNVSSERVAVYRKPKGHAIAHIKATDALGRPLKGHTAITLSISPDAAEDFVELAPGERTTMTFSATFRDDSLVEYTPSRRTTVRGTFLHFGTSAILIREKGLCRLTFEYAVSKTLRDEWVRLFGLPNLWYGQIVSEPATLVIK